MCLLRPLRALNVFTFSQKHASSAGKKSVCTKSKEDLWLKWFKNNQTVFKGKVMASKSRENRDSRCGNLSIKSDLCIVIIIVMYGKRKELKVIYS